MRPDDIVPGRARNMFVKALKATSVHAGGLPDPIPLGCVLLVFDDTVEPSEITLRGDLDTAEELKVLAGRSEDGSFFLDYYRVDIDNDGQTFSHGRIHQDGSTERLENFEGQWGRPIFPDDPEKTKAEHERIDAHNDRVREILREKGFR